MSFRSRSLIRVGSESTNKMPIGIAALKAAGVDTSALKLDIIKEVKAREILDSRGNPTIDVRHPSSIRELNGTLRRLQVQFPVQQG